MTMTDPIADMLTRVRNALRAGHSKVDMPRSRIKRDIARIMLDHGFISGVDEIDRGPQGLIRLKLRYLSEGSPAITGLSRVSRPGLRRYTGAAKLPRVQGGLGVAVMSTSSGIMTGHEAKERNVGGEVLCYIW
jgi:small subunit ribosomal protein S8